jgi:prepilin-type N-terminal cleavage/methylation domain-containing protein/prepilin-type processing-associated H-X9-DG protein
MRRGFTLMELLVVIAIFAVLVAIGVPVVNGVRARAASAKCVSNLRQIGVGLNLYLADHDQRMPTLEGGRASRDEDVPVIDTVLAEYLDGGLAVFACPADPGLAARTGTSYYWNVALNDQAVAGLNFLRFFETRSTIPVLSDKEGWHMNQKPKVNFLYADGHAGGKLQLSTGQ